MRIRVQPRDQLRWAAWALAVGGLLLGGLLTGSRLARQVAVDGATASTTTYEGTELGGDPAPDFRLTDQRGRRVALSDFRGKVVALTFMDSQCTDTCPLTAAEIRHATARLGTANADRVAFLAINVNDQANTPADVAEFTTKYQLDEVPNWHFLTGSAEQLEAVRKSYFIYAERTSATEIQHQTGFYLIDTEGRKQRYIDLPPNSGLGNLLAQQMHRLLGPDAAPLTSEVRSGAPPSAADQGMAPDVALTTFAGQRLSLSDLKGQAVVLNFWASWCAPCRTEMPSFETAYRAYRDRGVVFVGLAVQDDPDAAHAFVQELGITYPTGLDEGNQAAVRYRVTGLPTTVFIARDGTVVRRWTGTLTEQQLMTFVEELAR